MGTALPASSYLTDNQVKLLLRPIHPQRVLNLRGLSYVEGYDIRAELNRVFGFARWSQEILRQDLICEIEVKTNAGKPAWYVVYRSMIRLRIQAPDGTPLNSWDGSHVGESTHPVRGEAHGNAVTNSETYALRRCAINLGDQFGLSLYNKGSLEPIVRWTLVRPDSAVTADTDDVIQVAEESAGSAELPVPPGKPSAAPRAARSPGKGKAAAEEVKPLSVAEIVTRIKDATTVEELRGVYHLAGNAGVLNSECPETETTVQEFLYARSDELKLAKSIPGPEGNPGDGHGDQR